MRYMIRSRKFGKGQRDRDKAAKADYVALSKKHEQARLTVIGAEMGHSPEQLKRH